MCALLVVNWPLFWLDAFCGFWMRVVTVGNCQIYDIICFFFFRFIGCMLAVFDIARSDALRYQRHIGQ